MSRILGLDLGSHSVKVLVLEAAFRGSVVKKYTEVKLAGETRAESLRAALATLAADRGLVADQVAVAIPGVSFATQLLSLPFTAERQIEQTVGFEVEGQMLFDLEEIVYDYQPMAPKAGEEKTELLVGAVRKEQIASLLEMLKEHGIDPRVVTLPAVIYPPALLQGRVPPEVVCAVVDIGHERVAVGVGSAAGGFELARTFAGGGADLTRALAVDFKVAHAEARVWKEQHGDVTLRDRAGEEEAAYNALLRGLAPLVRELRQTFRSNQARFHHPVTQLFLCGGTARLPGLCDLLARELGVQAAPLPPPGEMEDSIPAGEIPVAAQAYALANRAQARGGRYARFNLRRNDFAFKGDFQYLKGKIGRLAAFAAVLLLVAAGNSYARIHSLAKREQVLDDKLCEMTTRVLSKCQKDYAVALAMLREHNAPAAAIPQVSAVELLAETTNRVPVDLSAKLTDMEINLNRMRLRGTVDSYDAVDKLTTALKGYKCFNAIKPGKVEKNPRDPTRFDFSLDVEVGCQPGPASQG